MDKYLTGFTPKVVCEVGVYNWSTSQAAKFVNSADTIILVEPNDFFDKEFDSIPDCGAQLELHQVAIADARGSAKLYTRPKQPNNSDASAFIDIIKASPSVVNDHYTPDEADATIVATTTFDEIDPGNIDLLFIDIEGAEWYVLKHLVSRPKFIKLETHGQRYTNPFMDEILGWMSENGYALVGKDSADSIYKLQ